MAFGFADIRGVKVASADAQISFLHQKDRQVMDT